MDNDELIQPSVPFATRDARVSVSAGTAAAHIPPLYPNQFVLGPCADMVPAEWVRRPIAEGLVLATHPQLPVTQVRLGDRLLALVGFALDPSDPQADDLTILTGLAERYCSAAELLGAAGWLGGRYVLIAVRGETERLLFTDALGLRQVFYTAAPGGGARWAMSQGSLAAEWLGLELDREARDWMASHAFRTDPEYKFPAAASPWVGLRHLLPNRYLDLATGAARRYWPDRPLTPLSPEEGIERSAALLQGLVAAAAARFPLALGLTAGLDSRMVLAASRPIVEKLEIVSVRQRAMPDDHADITVPAQLTARLGLWQRVIRAAASMSPEFSGRFKKNVFLAHDHYGADAEAIHDTFGRRKVALTGSGAEVARCPFRKKLPGSEWRHIGPAQLARLQRHGRHPFALRHYAEWLGEIGELHNVKLLDLFAWEQGHGNWLAMTQLEFDSGWRDIVAPFNCRELLTTLLSVDERYRRAPRYALFRRLIERLWPETLSEPINPVRSRGLAARAVGRMRRSIERYLG